MSAVAKFLGWLLVAGALALAFDIVRGTMPAGAPALSLLLAGVGVGIIVWARRRDAEEIDANIPRAIALGLLRLLSAVFWPVRRFKARRFLDTWKLQTQSGVSARSRGEQEVAERHFRAALAALQQLGPLDSWLGIDRRLTDGFRHLGSLYGNRGAFALMASAIARTHVAVSTRRRAVAEESEWLDKLTRLADLWIALGGKIWGTAGGYWGGIGLNLHKQVKVAREKTLGPDHLAVAQSLETVASLYHNDYGDDSGPMYRRALEIKKRALGVDHPDLAQSLENCAGANDDAYYRGSTDAEGLLRRAMAIREAAFGPHHPQVARSKECLANLCLRFDRNREAEAHASEALAIREAAQGSRHPDLTVPLELLASLSLADGRHDNARRLYIQAIRVLVRAADLDDPGRVRSLEVLEIVSPGAASDVARFERVSVSENGAYRLILQGKVERGAEGFVPGVTTQDLEAPDLLAIPGQVRRPGSTILARTANALEGLASVLTDIGKEEAGHRLEAFAEPLHFGVVDAARGDVLRELGELRDS